MKAIYINIDPYLQAVADWLNAGHPGTVPCFDPLPVAVTIPLGETAAILCPVDGGFDTANPDEATIDGVAVMFAVANNPSTGDEVAVDVVPGLSALAPEAKYSVATIPGTVSSLAVPVYVADGDASYEITIPITVLVRRETASGPVDLVDFTPPAAPPTAAQINTALGGTGAAEGQPLKGVSLTNATNAPAPAAADIKSALVAAGDEALEGVCLNGAKWLLDGETDQSSVYLVATPDNITSDNPALALTSPGS